MIESTKQSNTDEKGTNINQEKAPSVHGVANPRSVFPHHSVVARCHVLVPTVCQSRIARSLIGKKRGDK